MTDDKKQYLACPTGISLCEGQAWWTSDNRFLDYKTSPINSGETGYPTVIRPVVCLKSSVVLTPSEDGTSFTMSIAN